MRLICFDGMPCKIPGEHPWRYGGVCPHTKSGVCMGDMKPDDNCIPDCPLCYGFGFVADYSLPKTHPNYGKISTCPNKPIGLVEIEQNGLKPKDKEMRWGNLIQKPDIVKAKTVISRVLTLDQYGLIYIYGKPGNGKTTCGKLALLDALQNGWTGQYITHIQLMEWLRSSYDVEQFGNSEYRSRMKSLVSKRLLIVDEVSRDRETDFSRQSFSELIDSRYTSAVHQMSATIFISNYAPEDVLDDYQVDRIRDKKFDVVHFEDESMRHI